MVTARKQCLSGKRKAIGDESLITMVRILNDIREAEMETWKRGAKRQKKSKKWSSKTSKESSDESEEDLNSDGYEEVEIMDCIEVEM